LREGATIADQPGVFQVVGERVVFTVQEDARQLVTLENLALERIARAVRQTSAPQTWIVSGTVTEFQGSNYLLIDRAVVHRTAEPASAPQ
jgi:hypothetical protein